MTVRKENLIWLLLSLLVVILDQISKSYVSQHLNYAQPIVILPVFNLTLVHNPGAAFSFLSQAGGWQRWLFTAIAIGVSVYLVGWLLMTTQKQWGLKIGLALVIGGALGNLIDRLQHGYVIDFIQVHYQQWYFPDFNLADSAITLGAIFMIVYLLFFSKA